VKPDKIAKLIDLEYQLQSRAQFTHILIQQYIILILLEEYAMVLQAFAKEHH
jgi:hypothetical protein